MNHDEALAKWWSVKPFTLWLPISPQQTHMNWWNRTRNYVMKARQIATWATAGLLARRPSRQATAHPSWNSSVIFILFIPCNKMWHLLLETNNLDKIYRPMGTYIYIYTYIHKINYIHFYLFRQSTAITRKKRLIHFLDIIEPVFIHNRTRL
jgi:hypothetical protein